MRVPVPASWPKLRFDLTAGRLLAGLVALSAGTNILYLTGSFFMLEVYDRVIPSHSVPTLVALCVIAGVLYVFQGLFDVLRGRVLHRVGTGLNARLGPAVFDAVARLPLNRERGGDTLSPLRDLDQVRAFVASGGPATFFDLPWIPLYLVICFAFHPLIGVTALAGAVVLFGLALMSELGARRPAKAVAEEAGARFALVASVARNAEATRALGMNGFLRSVFDGRNEAFGLRQQEAADLVSTLGGISKVVRLALQSGVLAIGALLVIEGSATAGIIIASSIVTARALSPVEQAIAHWKGFVAARQAWGRLTDLLASAPEAEPKMQLPAPKAVLTVTGLTGAPPGSPIAVVQDATFTLKAGQALGVIGPSGSGKSSLARLLAGVWKPARGTVRLDGAALDQWDPDQLGRHLGYLPQDVELFSGSVVRNIARFDPQGRAETALAAARAAGVHEMILRLPDGYSTAIGEGGARLSAGQRQRVALARALYGDPFLVVLDEPNSNLDAEGDEALTAAILGIRGRGGIAVVVAHRPSALAGCDLVAVMREGRIVAFGPKDEVLNAVLREPPAPMRPAAVVTGIGAGAPRAANGGGA
jgi:ATP-binding cassette subfamily C protein